MKSLLSTLALPLLLLGGLAPAAPAPQHGGGGADQSGGEQGGSDELATLRSEVAELRKKVDELSREVASQGALLEQTVTYLQRQATETADLLPVFQAAEEHGFTAGINWQSREILLAGWRDWASAAGQGVPGVPAVAPAPTPAPASGGRR